jgi:hypothetical protein
VAGRQGGGSEIRDNEGDNEYNNETNKQTKNRFEEYQVAPGVRPEKGHLAPQFKIANEIICDHYGSSCTFPPFL